MSNTAVCFCFSVTLFLNYCQGFTKSVSLPRDRWVGYIKDYDGGTLMECVINPHVNYLDIPGLIARQREVSEFRGVLYVDKQ